MFRFLYAGCKKLNLNITHNHPLSLTCKMTPPPRTIALYKNIYAGIHGDRNMFDMELAKLQPPQSSHQSYNDFAITDEAIYCISDIPAATNATEIAENTRRINEICTVYKMLWAEHRGVTLEEKPNTIVLKCPISPTTANPATPLHYFETVILGTTALTQHQRHRLEYLYKTGDPMYLKYMFTMRMLDIVVSDYSERYKYYLDEFLYWQIRAAKARDLLDTNWNMPAICDSATLLERRALLLSAIGRTARTRA